MLLIQVVFKSLEYLRAKIFAEGRYQVIDILMRQRSFVHPQLIHDLEKSILYR